jgi:hypothetical protein
MADDDDDDEIPGVATAAYVIKKPNRAESRASAASFCLSLSSIVRTENDILTSDTQIHTNNLSPTYSPRAHSNLSDHLAIHPPSSRRNRIELRSLYDVRLSRLDGHDGSRSLSPYPSSTRTTRRSSSIPRLVIPTDLQGVDLASLDSPIKIQHVHRPASTPVHRQPVALLVFPFSASTILHPSQPSPTPLASNPFVIATHLPAFHPREIQMDGLLRPIRRIHLFRSHRYRRDHPLARLVDL